MEHFGTPSRFTNILLSLIFIRFTAVAHRLLCHWAEAVKAMKTKYLSGLLLLVVACSGGQTTGGGGDDGGATKQELKKKAAEAHAKPATQPGRDVCAQQGWYGDGECDNFCQDADTADCTPKKDDPVVCAEFIELPDGVCKRAPTDPCIGQDPDCAGGSDPSDPVACLAIAKESDGVCTDDPADPCDVYQDPDCHAGGGEPSDPIFCTLIAQEPDGVCKEDPTDPCIKLQDPDCNSGSGGGSTPGSPGTGTPTDPSNPNDPVICPAIAQLPDGVCKADPKDICAFRQDPDCLQQTEPSYPGVACAEYIEQPDNVCKRPADDPCIFQDPDCTKK